MTCPRCKSEETIYLFNEDRYDKDTTIYQYNWTYLECCECHLVFIESEIDGMKWGKTYDSLHRTKIGDDE